MPIVGINIKKINVERKDGAAGKVSIKNNISIKNVEEKTFSLGGPKQKAVGFTFEFVSEYEPNLGTIQFVGEVIVLDTQKIVKEIVDEWKKTKKVNTTVMSNVLNTALTKCNIRALTLAEDMNLPPPIPLPKINFENKSQKKETGSSNYIG